MSALCFLNCLRLCLKFIQSALLFALFVQQACLGFLLDLEFLFGSSEALGDRLNLLLSRQQPCLNVCFLRLSIG